MKQIQKSLFRFSSFCFNFSNSKMVISTAPWKKSYDQHRQHVKKQGHYFANKGLSSQGCGFSSGHVWM